MKPHPRTRRALKWGGIAFSSLLLLIMPLSGWRGASWATAGGVQMEIAAGRLSIASWEHPPPPGMVGGAAWKSGGFALDWGFRFERDSIATTMRVPLWAMMLACAAITALAWRADVLARRRMPRVACVSCGRDRTFLSGRASCPACGEPGAEPAPPIGSRRARVARARPKRSRIRRMLKWGGATIALLVLAAWGVSGRYGLTWRAQRGSGITIFHGELMLVWQEDDGWFAPRRLVIGREPKYGHLWRLGYIPNTKGWVCHMPFGTVAIIPANIAAVPWGVDLLRARRARRGLCPKCRYDRTGLAPEAVCPECGAAAPGA